MKRSVPSRPDDVWGHVHAMNSTMSANRTSETAKAPRPASLAMRGGMGDLLIQA
jgi:hypothetical protein